MKRNRPRRRRSAFALALLAAAAGAQAQWPTDRSQWARAIVWGDSRFDDHTRFPMRAVAHAAPRFDFRRLPAEQQRRYAAAFAAAPIDGADGAQDLGRFLERNDSLAFLVVKDDVLLYEGYFNGHSREATVTSFSVAKSFVSALVGIAIAEGRIGGVDEPVAHYVPELLARDARYRNVTLRHLLSMASGIRYEEGRMPWSDNTTTYYAPDLRAAAISSPIDGEPGRAFRYNNFNPLLLGLVLERATGRPVARYLEEKLWQPLGMEAAGSWSLDSARSGFEKMESGLNGRAIDFAKFGRLFLNEGDWNGRQLVPAAWVDESTRRDTGTDPAPHYQYFWWVNPKTAGRSPFYAAGKHGQYLYVVPEQKLVFVRFGRTDPCRCWVSFFEKLAERIGAAERAAPAGGGY